MEAPKIAKQMIGFQRAMFNNTFNAINIIQTNSENMMNSFFKQFPWMTDETRKPLNDSVVFLKESNSSIQKLVDEGLNNFEKMIDNK